MAKKLSQKDYDALKKIVQEQGKKIEDLTPTDFNKLAEEHGFVGVEYKDPQSPPEPPGPDQPPDVPPEPTGDVLYDSHIHSKLHDGQVRNIEKSEGSCTPNGLGIENHASGGPKVVVNADGTFSLVCNGPGHGRFYGYVLNYDATMEIEAAFWNDAPGQDLSLKMRSRHNEKDGSDGANGTDARFGGYGLSIDRSGYDAKREDFHNQHSQPQSGKLPVTPKTKEYFKIKFTVKDQGNSVRQTGEMNGQPFMNKVDNSPEPYMVNKALYDKQSYFWVRQNLDSGTGEIRIKSLKISKA